MNTNCTVDNIILIYAFRYSMSRETGSILDTVEAIKDNINSFTMNQIELIKQEISNNYNFHWNIYSSDIDSGKIEKYSDFTFVNKGILCEFHTWLDMIKEN